MLEKVKEITAEALGVETETLTAETSLKKNSDRKSRVKIWRN